MSQRGYRRCTSIAKDRSHGGRWRLSTSLVAAALAALAPAVGVDAAGWVAKASVPGGGCPGGTAVARGGDGRLFSFCGSMSEAYSPSTNTWNPFAADPVSRSSFAVAEGPNGAILVVGGADNTSGDSLGTTEFYSPLHNTWRAVASMPTPRTNLALTFASGRFYALGGADSVGNVMSTVEAYDPSTNHWSAASDLPGTGQCNLGAVTGSDGRLYAIGGMTFNCNTAPGWAGVNSVDAYSPATNRWTAVASLPTDHRYVGRSAFGITVGSDGRIYVIAGYEGGDCCSPGFRATPTVLRYTISTNAWTFIASLPAAVGPLSSAATSSGSGKKVYSVGGDSSRAALYKFTG